MSPIPGESWTSDLGCGAGHTWGLSPVDRLGGTVQTGKERPFLRLSLALPLKGMRGALGLLTLYKCWSGVRTPRADS